jgi:hypothetical protein
VFDWDMDMDMDSGWDWEFSSRASENIIDISRKRTVRKRTTGPIAKPSHWLLCAAAIIYGALCLLVIELTKMSISIISLLLAKATLAISGRRSLPRLKGYTSIS